MLIGLGVVALGTVTTYMTLFMPAYAVRQLGLPIPPAALRLACSMAPSRSR